MFHMRYLLHKTVYTHKAGHSIELMISDAFSQADKTVIRPSYIVFFFLANVAS